MQSTVSKAETRVKSMAEVSDFDTLGKRDRDP
jgi:hypothetical protein